MKQFSRTGVEVAMGKPGQPVDEAAWAAKRQRAIELLERGYSLTVVGHHVGASRAWVKRVNQERQAWGPRSAAPHAEHEP